MKKKFILDAACGGRMFWFNKKHPNTLYIDNRREKKGFIKERPGFEINPDIVMDFRKLEFKDKSFKLVVWDPPHLKELEEKSWLKRKYGCLNAETWQADIKKGFDECMRVLEDHGILIFKWSTSAAPRPKRDVSIKEVLRVIQKEPLFGHPSGSKLNTMWFCFMKIPGIER